MIDERFTLLKNVRLIDAAARKTDGCDLLFSVKNRKSRIVEIGKNLRLPEGDGGSVFNAHGRLVCPAFTDLRCLIPDLFPEQRGGFSSARTIVEDLASGLSAAVAGGYGSLLLSCGTKPPPDTPALVRAALQNCKKASDCRVKLSAPVTKGCRGETACDLERLIEAGASAVSAEPCDKEQDADKILDALRFCGERGLLFSAPIGRKSLDRRGSVNKGRLSAHYKEPGVDPLSELLALDSAIVAARETGLPLHFPLITLKKSVEAVRAAKSGGVPITCATAPFYFSMNESEVLLQGGSAKLLPPLRSEEDRLSVIEGLSDGTIDCICSDHTPRAAADKSGGIKEAAFGAIGLETAFGAGVTHLVLPGYLSIYRLIELMALSPAKLLGEDAALRVGGRCDLLFIDPDAEMVYGRNSLRSKCANTPFFGRALRGRVTGMFIDGIRQF